MIEFDEHSNMGRTIIINNQARRQSVVGGALHLPELESETSP